MLFPNYNLKKIEINTTVTSEQTIRKIVRHMQSIEIIQNKNVKKP